MTFTWRHAGTRQQRAINQRLCKRRLRASPDYCILIEGTALEIKCVYIGSIRGALRISIIAARPEELCALDKQPKALLSPLPSPHSTRKRTQSRSSECRKRLRSFHHFTSFQFSSPAYSVCAWPSGGAAAAAQHSHACIVNFQNGWKKARRSPLSPRAFQAQRERKREGAPTHNGISLN